MGPRVALQLAKCKGPKERAVKANFTQKGRRKIVGPKKKLGKEKSEVISGKKQINLIFLHVEFMGIKVLLTRNV